MAHSSWKRTLWVLVAGQGLTTMGFSFVFPFMPLYIQELGVADLRDATVWAGLFNALGAISMGVMGPIWGTLGDRFGRKRMLIRSNVGAAIFTCLMGFARSPEELVALRMLQDGVSEVG
ncbi:MAG TPA: MFS transporter [Chloroflexota bacterium]|nr:MFS transporter [Chloroflexota bacterium]